MTKFSESIVGKINKERIAPVPRWHFLFKDGMFWVLFVFSVILGSLSFSVIIHIAKSGDMSVFNHLQGSLFTSAVMLLPYFWLLFLIIFMVVAFLNWKCTKIGYHYKRRWIILGSVGVSVLIGSIFYASGMAKEIDKLMTVSIPLYNQSKHEALNELWSQPENGLLSGKIIEINEADELLIVRDESGKSWTVADSGVDWENDEMEKRGKIIKIIGRKNGEACFEAKEIRRCNNCQDDEDEDEEDKDDNENSNTKAGEDNESRSDRD